MTLNFLLIHDIKILFIHDINFFHDIIILICIRILFIHDIKILKFYLKI